MPEIALPPAARLFNSNVEMALRIAHLLGASAPQGLDLERLVSYDYLLVHSGDVEGGPESLHPAVPFRGSEWLVKRERIQHGLDLLLARELAEKLFKDGIRFQASELTAKFVDLLNSSYAKNLKDRSQWVNSRFSTYSDGELTEFMTAHVGRWGAEFEGLSLIQQVEL